MGRKHAEECRTGSEKEGSGEGQGDAVELPNPSNNSARIRMGDIGRGDIGEEGNGKEEGKGEGQGQVSTAQLAIDSSINYIVVAV